jgi:hypothetical protein
MLLCPCEILLQGNGDAVLVGATPQFGIDFAFLQTPNSSLGGGTKTMGAAGILWARADRHLTGRREK